MAALDESQLARICRERKAFVAGSAALHRYLDGKASWRPNDVDIWAPGFVKPWDEPGWTLEREHFADSSSAGPPDESLAYTSHFRKVVRYIMTYAGPPDSPKLQFLGLVDSTGDAARVIAGFDLTVAQVAVVFTADGPHRFVLGDQSAADIEARVVRLSSGFDLEAVTLGGAIRLALRVAKYLRRGFRPAETLATDLRSVGECAIQRAATRGTAASTELALSSRDLTALWRTAEEGLSAFDLSLGGNLSRLRVAGFGRYPQHWLGLAPPGLPQVGRLNFAQLLKKDLALSQELKSRFRPGAASRPALPTAPNVTQPYIKWWARRTVQEVHVGLDVVDVVRDVAGVVSSYAVDNVTTE